MPAVLFLLLIAQQVAAPAPPRDVPREKVSAAIAGRVTERGSGRPLPRAVVTLLKPNSSTPLATLTDEDGRYQFSGVEPGAYALSAGLDRHRSTYLPQRYGADTPGVSNLEPQRPNLELKPGETRAGLDFALWRALAIEGRVLDPWEMGMANVSVIVKRVTERVRASAYISTDDRGKYRAYGLAPGRYRVCAEIDQQSDAAAEAPRLAASCFPTAVDGANAGEVVLTSDDATGVNRHTMMLHALVLLLGLAQAPPPAQVLRGPVRSAAVSPTRTPASRSSGRAYNCTIVTVRNSSRHALMTPGNFDSQAFCPGSTAASCSMAASRQPTRSALFPVTLAARLF